MNNQTLLLGDEWYQYLQDTYGKDNVHWSVNSFDEIMKHPTSLRGYGPDEMANILGSGWTQDTYGSNGSGWKFIQDAHPDNMVFYHEGGGVHGGAYYGISYGAQKGSVKGGKTKVVDYNTYIPVNNDKATVIYNKDW